MSAWTNIIVAATGETSVPGNVFVAKTAEAIAYDADGNFGQAAHLADCRSYGFMKAEMERMAAVAVNRELAATKPKESIP